MSNPKLRTDRYLADCRELALAEIKRFLPRDTRNAAGLYELILDYPLRPAKALRPALCIGTCLALGGYLDAVLPTAAALELFHNAFLVHDDVEDGSALRRHSATLPVVYGVPIAVNVGDAMLALALEPLLDNVRAVGLGGSLRILRLFSRMARESVEGQMLELNWTRSGRWDICDRDYVRMVHKKTGWYSFITPMLSGALAAGADVRLSNTLGRFALLLGIAFQIQDDLLSLEGAEEQVGKEALGDLWEGKYTLPLLHALRTVPQNEREEALLILGRARPSANSEEILLGDARGVKNEEDVIRLAQLVAGRDGASLRHARKIARKHAGRAANILERDLRTLPESVHKDFLRSLASFVIDRAN